MMMDIASKQQTIRLSSRNGRNRNASLSTIKGMRKDGRRKKRLSKSHLLFLMIDS
jgi:hypothetical protein